MLTFLLHTFPGCCMLFCVNACCTIWWVNSGKWVKIQGCLLYHCMNVSFNLLWKQAFWLKIRCSNGTVSQCGMYSQLVFLMPVFVWWKRSSFSILLMRAHCETAYFSSVSIQGSTLTLGYCFFLCSMASTLQSIMSKSVRGILSSSYFRCQWL